MGSGASRSPKGNQNRHSNNQTVPTSNYSGLPNDYPRQRSNNPSHPSHISSSSGGILLTNHSRSRGGAGVGSNSSTSNSSSADMPCASCSSQFNLLSRKIKCETCELIFCEPCVLPCESSGGGVSSPAAVPSLSCLSCFVFRGPVLLRSQLVRLRVRDLMRQLRAKGVSDTRGCLTKAELVNLLANVPQVTLLMDDVMEESQSTSHANNNTNSNQFTSNGDAQHNGSTNGGAGNRNNNNNNSNYNQGDSSSSSRTNHSQQHYQCDSGSSSVPNGSADDSGKPSSQPKERKQLSSINNEEDIDKLHVRELKEILVNNFVVIRGLCEKDELVQKTKMLWRQEIGQRRAAAAMKAKFNDHEPNISEDDTCKICMDAPINCVLLECGHMVSCVTCGKQLAECPICRQYVVRAVHTFRT
ncbi:E3 ubiquitin-protein ligase rififylin-like [Symsagittifera roscoffensis]|uniref:E3 ubiquitin-protein ligase rififylin-like n=1 Tax=Symsagittifera roscoffensis TaxID=84072 RepID=UPI00307BF845